MSAKDSQERAAKSRFDFKSVESKFKKLWFDNNLYRAEDFSEKPKKYILAEFPYPSGKSLHCGHAMRYTVPDIYARYFRMQGYNVMYPMGWDAFGLPAEAFAIKTGTHPAIKTAELIGQYREAIKDLGYGIDWEREVNTTDPGYFKWTQWIFLRLYEAGLAELREQPIWWCPNLKTVLAEEEVIKDANGNLISERGEHPVERKLVKQWVLKITEYADKLLEGLANIEFPESVRAAQTNWIGRSEGALVKFALTSGDEIEVFTTRPDTLSGVTFLVLAPEAPVVKQLLEKVTNREQVEKFIDSADKMTDLERQQNKEKAGVELEGVLAENPLHKGEMIPVYLANYVLMGYGTGMVMGVPADDERDQEFAEKYGIKITPVYKKKPTEDEIAAKCDEVIEKLISEGKGERKVTYKLRDWLFTRQRYWGEPIPLIHKEDGTIEAIVRTDMPDEVRESLPLKLPEVPNYEPTDDGQSPLVNNPDWVNTKARDGSAAKRETNTMPNWAGSSWYFLRYIDPKNDEKLADADKLKYWLPVDHYFGGSEHTTLHLLYSRFWHQFLFDEGVVPTPEPYQKRTNGGLLLAEDGRKMSKSYGNVVEPGEKIEIYGADAFRMYIAFLGPYEGTFPYNESSLKACHRIVEQIYSLRSKVKDGAQDSEELLRALNSAVKNMGEMMGQLKMNTCVSEIMILTKVLVDADQISKESWLKVVKIISPFAVFLADELWHEANGLSVENWDNSNSVHLQPWPEVEEKWLEVSEIDLPVQINGKMRGHVRVAVDASESDVQSAVERDEKLKKYLEGQSVKKLIYRERTIANFIVG